MQRHRIPVRENWMARVESLGFSYHTLDGATYWDESVFYEFNYDQVATLETATHQLYGMCLEAVDHVLKNDLLSEFSIPEKFAPFIKSSWNQETPSIYGRFDLSWDGDGMPKMLEFNADTPTSLFEASVIQWSWLNDFCPEADQFNSIHGKLVAWWKKMKPLLKGQPLHFSCLHEFPEDLVNVRYLEDCAAQADIPVEFISVHDIGLRKKQFIDLNGKKIHNIFKLYPWEWMMHEEFGRYLSKSDTLWIEPPWKMILSNKAILPILWELFPDSPYLLECYFDDPGPMKNYAIKPILSREGANVTLVENDTVLAETGGEYGDEGFVYQELHKLPSFDGNYPVIGSWVIGGQAAGIGIRETTSLVTDNFSRFVPHVISSPVELPPRRLQLLRG